MTMDLGVRSLTYDSGKKVLSPGTGYLLLGANNACIFLKCTIPNLPNLKQIFRILPGGGKTTGSFASTNGLNFSFQCFKTSFQMSHAVRANSISIPHKDSRLKWRSKSKSNMSNRLSGFSVLFRQFKWVRGVCATLASPKSWQSDRASFGLA